jgi:hypothetical protein
MTLCGINWAEGDAGLETWLSGKNGPRPKAATRDRCSDGNAAQHAGDCNAGRMASSMTFRIEGTARGRFTVFIVFIRKV